MTPLVVSAPRWQDMFSRLAFIMPNEAASRAACSSHALHESWRRVVSSAFTRAFKYCSIVCTASRWVAHPAPNRISIPNITYLRLDALRKETTLVMSLLSKPLTTNHGQTHD